MPPVTFEGRATRRSVAGLFLGLSVATLVLDWPMRIATRSIWPDFPVGTLPKSWQAIAWPQPAAGLSFAAGVLLLIYLLALGWTATVRRLHDLDLSGWYIGLWFLFDMLDLAQSWPDKPSSASSTVFLAVLIFVPGVGRANRYGPEPA